MFVVAVLLMALPRASAQSTPATDYQFSPQLEIHAVETEIAAVPAPSQIAFHVPTQPGLLSDQGAGQVAIATPYHPITGKERFNWFVRSSVGPQSIGLGIFKAGIQTAGNHPPEYGPHWEGFGKRVGIHVAGVVSSNAMEASIGSLWGEDPRYFQVGDRPVSERVKNVVVMTFAARYPEGNLGPAYARYIAKAGSNFLSNTWRAPSESSTNDALSRMAFSYVSKLAANAFKEFWPYILRRIHRN